MPHNPSYTPVSKTIAWPWCDFFKHFSIALHFLQCKVSIHRLAFNTYYYLVTIYTILLCLSFSPLCSYLFVSFSQTCFILFSFTCLLLPGLVTRSSDLSFLLPYLFKYNLYIKLKFKCHPLLQILLEFTWLQWSIYLHNLISLCYHILHVGFLPSLFGSSLKVETVNYSTFSALECLAQCRAHN